MTEVSYPSLFDERRTAQAAAFLLHKAGGRLPVLKLMKLLYLAERESLRLYGEPIAGDHLVSMPHGPVLSRTYDLMNGSEKSGDGGWDCWMDDKAAHEIALRDPSRIRTPDDLLELSDGDLKVLDHIWAEFGHMGKWELRDYTHSDACPEWEDPRGSSRPIPMGRVLRAVGYEGEALSSVLEHIKEQTHLKAAF